MAFSQRDVVTIKDSNTDGTKNDGRLARFVVMSSKDYNSNSKSLLACPLTGSKDNRFNVRCGVRLVQEHMEGGTIEECFARFDTLTTLSQDRILRIIGKVHVIWYKELITKANDFIRVQA